MKIKFFIIVLPNGEELLYRCDGWTGMTHIVPYIAGEYADDCMLRPVGLLGAIDYLIRRKVC